MSTTEGKISPFHPFDPVDFAHPYEKLRQAREHCPVGTFPVEHVPVSFYFLAQDGDVRSSFHSPVLSNQGNFELSKDYPPVITQMDGAEHERLRTILETSFNAQIFKEARPFIVRKASQLIEEMLSQPGQQADFMKSVAQQLPTLVITYLMGIPERDAENIRQWNAMINSLIPGPYTQTDEWKKFEWYIRGLIAGYQAAERASDTIISRLIENHLGPDEILMTVFQLLVAGADTTTMLLGSLLYELLREPTRWNAVKADPKLIASSIEETLRLHPPLNWVMRSCPVAVSIHGETLPAGSRVVLGIASANRDAERWGDTAEEFDSHRRGSANHLAFGAGVHFCLGAQLARLQAQVVLATLIERIPLLRLSNDYRYDALVGPMIHGPRSLSVTWS